MSDYRPSIDLLESTHSFPCQYQIKAIGRSDDNFAARVVEAAAAELASPLELESSVRTTEGGRHVAVTLHLTVQNAEQVRAIYAKVHAVEGVTLLF